MKQDAGPYNRHNLDLGSLELNCATATKLDPIGLTLDLAFYLGLYTYVH